MFPTYTALVLAALGWISQERRRGWPVGLWAATVGAFFVLSLGPRLHVAGQSWPVPLPAALLYQLPIANLTRAPGRFVVLVLLGLAMLVAFGLAAVLTRGWGWGLGVGTRDQGSGSGVGCQGTEFQPPNPHPQPPVASSPLSRWACWGWSYGRRPTGWRLGCAASDRDAGEPCRPAWRCSMCRFARLRAAICKPGIESTGDPLIGGYLARAPIYPLLDGVPVFTQFQTLDDAPDLCAPPLDGLGPSIFTYFTTSALVPPIKTD